MSASAAASASASAIPTLDKYKERREDGRLRPVPTTPLCLVDHFLATVLAHFSPVKKLQRWKFKTLSPHCRSLPSI
jgi:hypothetical protein